MVQFVQDEIMTKYKFLRNVSNPKQPYTFVDNTTDMYRLQVDEDDHALNMFKVFVTSAPRAPHIISAELRKSLFKIYGTFLSQDGSSVDYEGMRKSNEFVNQYLPLAAELQTVDLKEMLKDTNQYKAFFINIYNALLLHGVVVFGSVPSGFIPKTLFFTRTSYNIGGCNFSLDDIEHGILRGTVITFVTHSKQETSQVP